MLPLTRDSKAGRARRRLVGPVYQAVSVYLFKCSMAGEGVNGSVLHGLIEQALLTTRADLNKEYQRRRSARVYHLRGLLTVEE